MEPTDLTDDELTAELRRARGMLDICDSAGEVDASILFSATVRAIENEQRRRRDG